MRVNRQRSTLPPRRAPVRASLFVVAVSCLILAGSALPNQNRTTSTPEARPFPQHLVYAAGSIIPDLMAREALDGETKRFYGAWKAKYLKAGCGADRYYIAAGDSLGRSALTVSEAQGYGMTIVALMAGADPDARAIFDGMYRYYRDHPSRESAYLMSWEQAVDCGNIGGNDSATDADMDIAYALLLADRQWGRGGNIRYHAEAAAALQAILQFDIDAADFHILLGSWGLKEELKYRDGARSSDFVTDHLRAFQNATGDSRWGRVLDNAYAAVTVLQDSFSPTTGLLPDFVRRAGASPRPVTGRYLEGANDGDYYFNACRTPWRLATDYLLSGDARAKLAVSRINKWIRAQTGDDPAKIRAGYRLSGEPLRGSGSLNMAFLAPLGVGAMVDPGNQEWLNRIWKLVLSRSVGAEHYYENTLKMMAMLVMSGNWWAP